MTEADDLLLAAINSKDAKKIEEATKNFLVQSKDALSEWLDRKAGSNIKDKTIFEDLPGYWEDEFHKDMAALNVSRMCMYVEQQRTTAVNYFFF